MKNEHKTIKELKEERKLEYLKNVELNNELSRKNAVISSDLKKITEKLYEKLKPEETIEKFYHTEENCLDFEVESLGVSINMYKFAHSEEYAIRMKEKLSIVLRNALESNLDAIKGVNARLDKELNGVKDAC